MIDYFANLPTEDAVQMEQLSHLAFTLRENRRKLLQPYNVSDEAELLQQIKTANVSEHPAYEHYLGALTLAAFRREVITELKALLERMGG